MDLLAASAEQVSWTGPAASLGVGAVLVWLIYHYQQVYVPRLIDSHREERKQLHDDLMSMMAESSQHQEDVKVSLSSIDMNIRGMRDDLKAN